MKQRTFLSVLSCTALLLSGCGSVYDGSTQRIEFLTPGVIGADCRAESKDYIYNVYTPDQVVVERSFEPLTITCRADNYNTQIVEVKPTGNKTSAWNILNGVVPGTAYDAGSRALAEYPNPIVIMMDPIVIEPETIVPIYDETAEELYIPPPIPYRADTSATQTLTGKK